MRTSKTKSRASLIISSDEEELGKDFAPQELRIMGATNVGAIYRSRLSRQGRKYAREM